MLRLFYIFQILFVSLMCFDEYSDSNFASNEVDDDYSLSAIQVSNSIENPDEYEMKHEIPEASAGKTRTTHNNKSIDDEVTWRTVETYRGTDILKLIHENVTEGNQTSLIELIQKFEEQSQTSEPSTMETTARDTFEPEFTQTDEQEKNTENIKFEKVPSTRKCEKSDPVSSTDAATLGSWQVYDYNVTEPEEEKTTVKNNIIKDYNITVLRRILPVRRFHQLHNLRTNTDQPTTETPSCMGHQRSEDQSSTTLINFPFAVSVQRKGAHYTTGALLDKRWIVTSAGEYFNMREAIKILRARLGSVDCKRGGIVVPLKKIEIHPEYTYGMPNYDVALLMMAYPVQYTDFIRPIALSNIKTKVISAKFMTIYWAILVVKGSPLPTTAKERIKQNSLRVSTQRLIPKESCLEMNLHNATLYDSTLCLKPFMAHHTPCLPDAGAVVVAEDGLWGITSGWAAYDCLQNQSPTLFTRLSSNHIRQWLDELLLTTL